MSARILITGSRSWTNVQFATDAINAGIMLLGSHAKEAVLVHGAAQGADVLCANVATGLGMATEAHPAAWDEHAADCPVSHQGLRTCKKAGHRRNAEMIAGGAGLCLAFPTHGLQLAEGEDRKDTSRGTWDCATKAKDAGIPTLVVWGATLYPFGHPGMDMLRRDAERKNYELGPQGQMPTLEAWLPF
jgi:hypothetical protein